MQGIYLFILFLLSFQGSGRATVIELFTSQGCSSCPPAEAWISELRRHPGFMKDVIPMVWHVDYWDRLGWKDTLAAPEYTERQYRFSRQWNSTQVYTPGIVVDGKELRNWSGFQPGRKDKDEALKPELSDKTLRVRFSPSPSQTVWMAVLSDGPPVPVSRGENAGQKLLQDFVVRRLEKGSPRKGSFEWTVTAESGYVVVWIEEGGDPTPRRARALRIN